MAQGHLLGNRYRLDAVVGRGGMGTVWQAYDVMLDREVAIKEVLLPPGLSPDERNVLYERTFREARASARLNHPGVVTVHDVVEETGRPWIVMEFVRARSLQDLIDEGPVPPPRAAEIGRQTLAALRHAHEKGILHRDVKPSNVLITGEDRAVLTDFGIAQVEGDSTLTQTGLVMGSPAYIPPERAQGERAVPASDLWSLGATLYAAVEGRAPFERPDAMASLAAALSEQVPPPRNAGPLRPVLEGLLARQPRYRMTADQALPLLAEVASRAVPPVPPPRHGVPATVLDDTALDQPSAQYGPPPPMPPEIAETVVDDAEVEPPTRREYGNEVEPPTRREYATEQRERQEQRQRAAQPARPAERERPELSRPAPTPPSESEVRTMIQPDWLQQPQTPPPYSPWQQQQTNHQAAPLSSSPVSPYPRERSKTTVVVTIVVILFVVAVLVGAVILRQNLQ